MEQMEQMDKPTVSATHRQPTLSSLSPLSRLARLARSPRPPSSLLLLPCCCCCCRRHPDHRCCQTPRPPELLPPLALHRRSSTAPRPSAAACDATQTRSSPGPQLLLLQLSENAQSAKPGRIIHTLSPGACFTLCLWLCLEPSLLSRYRHFHRDVDRAGSAVRLRRLLFETKMSVQTPKPANGLVRPTRFPSVKILLCIMPAQRNGIRASQPPACWLNSNLLQRLPPYLHVPFSSQISKNQYSLSADQDSLPGLSLGCSLCKPIF